MNIPHFIHKEVSFKEAYSNLSNSTARRLRSCAIHTGLWLEDTSSSPLCCPGCPMPSYLCVLKEVHQPHLYNWKLHRKYWVLASGHDFCRHFKCLSQLLLSSILWLTHTLLFYYLIFYLYKHRFYMFHMHNFQHIMIHARLPPSFFFSFCDNILAIYFMITYLTHFRWAHPFRLGKIVISLGDVNVSWPWIYSIFSTCAYCIHWLEPNVHFPNSPFWASPEKWQTPCLSGEQQRRSSQGLSFR